MSRRVLLLELSAYDVAGAAVVPLYLSDLPYATEPTDTPASVTFFPLLVDPLSIRRRVQGIRGGVITPSLGEIRALNDDGRLDAWAAYAFDGRPITAKLGPGDGAYATDFTVVFTGTMDRVDVTEREVVIRLRDAIAAFDTPLLTDLFAGDNVPPDGLEGEADLEGAVKPRVYGSVRNVPLTLVNAQKLIYHVSDNECDVVTTVYDSGFIISHMEMSTDVAIADLSNGQVRTAFYVPKWGFYVAVARIGVDGLVITSPDLTDWTTRVTAPGDLMRDVVWAPEESLAVAVGFDNRCYTSPDGVTWTSRSIAAGVDFNGVAYGNGVFVAVASSSSNAYTSPDGITWTARALGASYTLAYVRFANGVFVAVGTSGAILTSADGITWTVRTSPVTTTWIRVEYFERTRTWVLTNEDSTSYLAVSVDAVTWSLRLVPESIEFLSRLCVTPQVIVCGSSAAGSDIVFSMDGVVWKVVENPNPDFGVLTPLVAADGTIALLGVDASSGTTNAHLATLSVYGLYASATDLEDDDLAPAPGTAKAYLGSDGTYVRLGSIPAGQVTADVTQGATAADRSAAALLEAVLTDAGYTSADWVAADFTALDTADGSAVHGLYVTGQTRVAECLERLASGVGAFWTLDNLGRFRVQQLAAPSGSSTFTITDDTCLSLARLTAADPLAGIPSYRTTLRFNRNHTVLRGGLAAGVSAARRAELAREWQEVVSTDTAVQTAHPLAQAIVDDATYATAADAQAEVGRRQALRGTMRHAYAVTVPLDDYADVDLGAVGTLQVSRFGLSGGQLVRVLGVEPRGRERTVTLLCWY